MGVEKVIVAFSGPSGSGKTTIIERLPFKQQQEDNFVFLRLMKNFVSKDKFDRLKSQAIHEERSSKSPALVVMSLVYSLIVYIEFLFKYFWYEVLFRNKIIVLDRYIYDYWVTVKCNLGALNFFNNWLLMSFPKPYLLFYLQVSPKTLVERNKNPDSPRVSKPEFHKEVVEAYDFVAEKKSVLTVDNEGGVDETLAEVEKHILYKQKLDKVSEVVIMGLDGSGKSTLVAHLRQYLDELNIPNAFVHFYHDYILYKFLKRVGYYKRRDQNLTEEEIFERSRQHNIRARKSGRPFIWGFLHFFDSWVQYVFFRLIYWNKLIVYDRYFYDFLVSFANLSVPNTEFFVKFIPGVKNKFFLDCPPELCFQRKPENTKEFFEVSHGYYMNLAKKYNFKVLDATVGGPEEILSQLLSKIKT